jgi:hypothetical protein
MARMGGRDRWRGFAVLDGRLWYRPPSGRSQRPGLRFEPEVLLLVGSGDPPIELPLPWDDGEKPGEGLVRPAWSLHALPRGRGSRVAFRLTIARPGGGRSAPRHVKLKAGALPPSDELPALCRYLSANPGARPGLADADRARTLLARLAANDWRRPGPPHEPLAGERLDLHVLVEATLDELGWRRIDGRPVAGEPRPATDDVVDAVRRALPDEQAARMPDERIRDEVDRHRVVGAWPFDALL